MEKKITKKNIIFILIALVGIISYFYYNFSSRTEPTNSIDVNVVYTSKDPKEALKDTSFSGTFTDEEKSKIVEMTDTLAKLTINNDYKTDNIDTLKTFVNYMDDNLKINFSDDILQKQIDNLVSNEHVSKLQDINYTKITRDEDKSLIAVNFIATVRVVNDKNSKESGKTFSKVECGFAFDKEWKVSQFSIGQYK
ncbi:hypothetical protein NNC19_09785 [Clostridium sp. SHJSY1]|uniref:hypothetical protein n=1 Tax=Clostridium sp. SHJSY1 TaxID=2942483 RepID=UPI002875FF1D|nr:hypothetical protein [Clostridium sp. SHJSY1]MDS0525968.1 hypothetical protein [Clostridium sp. SHJSY1]